METVTLLINRAGESFAHFAGPMLLQSSILIIVLFGIDLVLRQHVRAALRYGLWMLLPVKLLLPASLSLPTGLGYWVERPNYARIENTQSEQASSPDNAAVVIGEQNGIGLPVTSVESVASSHPSLAEETPINSARVPLSLPGFLFLAWCIGTIGTMVFLGYRVNLANRLLRSESSAEVTEELLKLVSRCCLELSLRQPVCLKSTTYAISPFVYGLFRPTIILPNVISSRLDHQQLRAVLLHELAHIKRGDLWANFAQTLLQVAYFYHPLLWLANARICRIREQAVDEMVLVTMRENADSYPETLLTVAKLAFQKQRLALGMIGIMERKSALGQRIRHMLSNPLPTNARLGISGVTTVALGAFLLLPMARGQKQEIAAPVSAEEKTPATATATYEGKTAAQWFESYDFGANITEKYQVIVMKAFVAMGTNAVPFLVEKLATPNIPTSHFERNNPRQKAAWILKNLGKNAEGAVPQLAIALMDDYPTAMYAAEALENLGSAAASAAPDLLESLRLGNGAAASALVRIAPDHPDLLPLLIEIINVPNSDHNSGQTGFHAARALGQLGSRAQAAIPSLVELLEEGSDSMRHAAAGALRRLVPDDATIMAKVEAAQRRSEPPPPPPIEELLAKAKASSGMEQIMAIQNLAQALSYAKYKKHPVPDEVIREQIVPFFGSLLDEKEPRLWQSVAAQTAVLGEHAKSLRPRLLELLKDEKSIARGNILAGLNSGSPGDVTLLPVIIPLLTDWNDGVRNNAASLMKNYGPEAEAAVPALTKMLDEPNGYMRYHAALGLWSIAKRLPPPDILEIDDAYIGIISAAIKPFAESGSAAKSAVPALKKLARHWDKQIRQEARDALAKISPESLADLDKEKAAAVIPAASSKLASISHNASSQPKIPFALAPMIRKLRSTDHENRLEGLGELGRMGTEAREAVPFVLALLKDSNAETRSYAAAVLGDIDNAQSESLQALVKTLNDPNPEVRANALQSLRKFGPKATEAIEPVKLALRDKNESVRSAAELALKKIQPENTTP